MPDLVESNHFRFQWLDDRAFKSSPIHRARVLSTDRIATPPMWASYLPKIAEELGRGEETEDAARVHKDNTFAEALGVLF